MAVPLRESEALRLQRLFTASAAESPWTFWVYLILLSTLCGIVSFIGVTRSFIYSHDIMAILDGSWRVLNGQIPHKDFFSIVGPLPYFIAAGGLKLSNYEVRGLGDGYACWAFFLGMVSWRVCRGRMSAFGALLAGLAIPLLAIAPFPIGIAPSFLSPAMSYNRHGYAMLGIIFCEAWQPVEKPREQFIGAFLAGGMIALTLFGKASYFLVAIVVMLASLLIWRPRLRQIGLLAGFAAAGIPFFSYFGFNLAPMFNDLKMMAGARQSIITHFDLFWGALEVLLSSFVFLTVAAILAYDSRSGDWRSTARIALLPMLILGAGLAVLLTNYQRGGVPLTSLAALILMNEAATRMGRSPAKTYYLALACCCLAVFLPDAALNASGLGYSAWQRIRPVPQHFLRFESPALQNLYIYDVPLQEDSLKASNGTRYVRYINEGTSLLARYSTPGETSVTFDQFNPFPYAMRRPPPHGGSMAMAYGNNFDDQHTLTPARFFGGADVVMVPKYPVSAEATRLGLDRIYGPTLRSSYSICAESDWWALYKQKGRLDGCAPTAGGIH